MNKYWSDEEFITVVKNSKTISHVLKHFGLPGNQGYYNKLFHKTVNKLNLDISHITEYFKQRKFYKKESLDILLTKGRYRATDSLKQRLLKEGVLSNKCYECKLSNEWNDKPLSLHLDHINGDNTDNTIDNLRILCPNCHSQTDTYCGSKKKKEKHIYKHVCESCGGIKKCSKSKTCQNCRNRKTKIEYPAPEIVLQMTKDLGFVKTGKQLGVSDNAIRKFLKRNGFNQGP